MADEAVTSLEWIETNGLGGWSSSSVSGAHTRSYHGLLVASDPAALSRRVLLSRLDETVRCEERTWELATRRYPGAVNPEGCRFLRSFARRPFPVFEYETVDFVLRKQIAAVAGENVCIVTYELVQAAKPVVLELRPFIAGRGYHELGQARDASMTRWSFEDGTFSLRDFPGCESLSIHVPGGRFTEGPDWYYRFEYLEEKARGLSFLEDLFTPGFFSIALRPNCPITVVAAVEHAERIDGPALVNRERERRAALVEKLPVRDAFAQQLALAADQFVLSGPSRIVAGYHWFTEWGRDTMISLPGLCLCTGRFDDAQRILLRYCEHISEGMIPNRFPDYGTGPEYNTADASLWFFVAVYRYLQYSNDLSTVERHFIPALEEILSWHLRGTRFGIRMDEDGLITAGAKDTQLTWMDARIEKWPVTSRHGKAVEINALWYNALAIFAELCRRIDAGTKLTGKLPDLDAVRHSFHRVFWNPAERCLFDCVNEAGADQSIRPNQILAIGLPFSLLSAEEGEQVLRRVEKDLLTPRGIRTLSPAHPEYRERYDGDLLSRHSAYHQGTVWPWLIGPYCTAVRRIRGEAGKREVRELLTRFAAHLDDEGGAGTISEIFDAEPPHAPRGSIAQAWSVGELLRSYIEEGHSI
jgi:predicted glycogen debranching enzyme